MDDITCQEYFSDEYNVHCYHYTVLLVFILFLPVLLPRLCVSLIIHRHCWLMCWIFNPVFYYASVTILLVFIRQLFSLCLHCISKLFPPFLSILFHCKSIIFIYSKAVTICCGCLLLALCQDLPNILPYHLLIVHWASIKAWYRDLTGNTPCAIYLVLFDPIGCKNLGLWPFMSWKLCFKSDFIVQSFSETTDSAINPLL